MTERDRVQKIGDDPFGVDPNQEHTPSELEDLASKILYDDRARIKSELGEVEQKIVIFLLDREVGFPAEIADTMNATETAVSRNIVEMIDRGWIKHSHIENGIQYYRLAEEAEFPEGLDCPAWLTEADLHYRKRREIYSNTGQIDPSIREGMFERSHPQGEVY